MLAFILAILAFGFGVARFIVPVEGRINTGDIFKDAAHLFVGFLFGVAVMATINRSQSWPFWSMAIGLTALEVVAFLVRMK